MKRLENKVAIVTGGSSGIGKEIVKYFAGQGARVVFCGRDHEHGTGVEKEVRESGGDALFVAADVTDSDQSLNLVNKTLRAYERIDVLVCNAGGTSLHAWPDDSEDNWDATIRQNLYGMYYLCRHSWPHMVKTQGGSIIAITSFSAWGGVGKKQLEQMGGVQPNPAYQAAKAGMEGLVVHLAGRGGEHGIRVNAIRPGRILTAEWEQSLGEETLFWGLYREIQMLKQHGRSEDVAAAALFLASDESKFITAEIIEVNGGAIGKV